MVIIEPSILSADFARLGEHAREAETAGAEEIQIDVMDGCFVPNITFGPGVVEALKKVVRIPLDVHLMIVQPERHLDTFAQAGANRLIVHQETCPHLHRTLESIRELGIEVGVALNPSTPIGSLEEVLHLVDLVQIMTVNPGFGGQDFIYSQLDKIHRLHEMIRVRGLKVGIGVDGGIDTTTAPLVVQAGATMMVAGSSIFNGKGTVAENLAALRASIANL